MKILKILIISDEESPALWDYFDRSKLADIDLIISCGDLAPQYLFFGHLLFRTRFICPRQP